MGQHKRDADCSVIDGSCTECGVYHGEPCGYCNQRDFHGSDCPAWQPSIRRYGMSVCPNCQQWQRPYGDGADCLNRCRERGFAE